MRTSNIFFRRDQECTRKQGTQSNKIVQVNDEVLNEAKRIWMKRSLLVKISLL
ncbi:hypothetical protein HN51_035729 [Arachis hypogaea]